MKHAALLLLASVTVASTVAAQPAADDANYPDRPIRLIVPFPAGSSTDVISRIIAQKLSTRMGQQFVIDNRPGASGNIGADALAKSAPDGYTMGLITASTHGVAPAMGKLPYDPIADFKPVSMIGGTPYVLVLYAGLPAKSISELVALAKAKPATITYGSAGLASLAHLAGALFAAQNGIELVHVPYKSSSQSSVDLITGRLDMQFATIAPVQESIRAGQLRALATSSARRASALPDVPTMIEAGVPNYDVELWMAYTMPPKTPDAIVNRLNREITAILTTPEVVETMQKQGYDPEPGLPGAVTERIRAEIARWSALAKTGFKAE